jgi:hypothetical protein
VRSHLSSIENSGPGHVSPLLHAEHARFTARLAELEGRPDAAEAGFKSAAGTLREIGTPFHLAVVLLEHGEFLISNDRSSEGEPFLSEAKDIFGGLKARPWLERVERAMSLKAVAP